jgi:glycosyltransferase involved in cell wall biosynthesis
MLRARLRGPFPTAEQARAHAHTFDWMRVAARHREIYASASRLRVVFLGHTAVLSGGEIALATLLPALDVDAHVILGEDGPLAERLRQGGATVEILPLAARGLRRSQLGRPLAVLGALAHAIRLAYRLRALRPDIVHTNTLKAALYGGLAGRLARIPVVWHIRDRIADDYLPSPIVHLVRTAARVLPRAIIVNSDNTGRTLAAAAVTVPSPVELLQHERRRVTGAALRVGILGRIAPWKGQDVFLEAFASAFPAGDEQAWIIGAPLFGDDEERFAEMLHDRASALGVAPRIEFRGHRDDVPAELAELDILVHASVLAEPFGQVVVQGMAAGLAVVATDAGGPAEIIQDGYNGLLYPPGDAHALADALIRFARDPELRRRLGAAGRLSAAPFAPEVVAPRVLEVYRSIL